MNCNELDGELADIDKPAESWPDMLNNMFDGDVDVIEVDNGDEETRQRFRVQRTIT